MRRLTFLRHHLARSEAPPSGTVLPPKMPVSMKCVVVGDGTVGKTCMLMSYCQDAFPVEYVPTIFETYAATVNVGNESATLLLFDTAGQEDYDRLRILSYPGTDVFLLCFSVVCESSLVNVEERWIPELRLSCGKEVPIILVGTKIDLRNDEELRNQNERILTEEDGRRVANRINAHRYMECSALTQTGVREIFIEAILAILSPDKKDEKSRCCRIS